MKIEHRSQTDTEPRPLTETERLLFQQYGWHLSTDDLAAVLGYRGGRDSVLQRILENKFPIKTFRLGRYRVADFRDVARYLDDVRASRTDASR